MKARFELNGKVIENSEIEGVSLLIKLDKLDKPFEDTYEAFDYIDELIGEKCDIYDIDDFELDCPCTDLAYLYNDCFTGEGEEGFYPCNKKELVILIKSYNELLKVFDKDQVRVAVYSNYLFDDYNEDDFSLEEFLEHFKLIK